MTTVVDREELRRQADEIVRRPEFREDPPSLVERALDWVLYQLGGIFGSVAGSGGYALGYTLLVLALLAVVYLLWRVFPRGRLVPHREPFSITTDTVIRRSRADWLAEAAEAEAADDWDRAVHARYHALATGLAAADELPADVSTTSGERREAFAGRPDSVGRFETFDRVTDTYEHVHFGGRRADRPDSRQLADADRTLLENGGS